MNTFPILLLSVAFFQIVFATSTSNRIFKGETVVSEDIPFHVLVQPWYRNLKTKPLGHSICGGSLISNKHILTAAHCLYWQCREPVKVVVYFGSNMLYRGTRITIAKWIIHDDYLKNCKNSIYVGDIALLVMKRNVTFSNFIQPIGLPYNHTNDQLENATALVSGYGLTEYGRTNFLRATNVSMASKSFCDLNKTPEDHICAKIHNQQTDCIGDSGGPVVINNTLYGIVSFGPKDCAGAEYSIYTSVIYYMDWILAQLELLN